MIEETENKQVHYFRVKEYDFNDVFDYETIVKGTYDQVKQYLIEKYKEEYREKLDIDESTTDINVFDWMPITDELGNEVPETDSRYDELNEQQEARLSTSFTAELIEDESEIEYYKQEKRFSFVDLTQE